MKSKRRPVFQTPMFSAGKFLSVASLKILQIKNTTDWIDFCSLNV